MDADLERHSLTCRFMELGRFKKVHDSDLNNKNMLIHVDVTLHLFATTEAVERSQRFLLGVHQNYWVGYHTPERGIYLTIRDFIPVLYLRQGRDEEAYKIIYRHRNMGGHDPTNTREIRAGLNVLGRFPGPTGYGDYFFLHQSFEQIQDKAPLGHQVALTLMAIKALRCLQDIQRVSVALRGTYVRGNAIPQETIENICEFLGTKSSFLESLFDIDLIKVTREISWRNNKTSQMRALVRRCVYETGRTNRHIWRWMLDTDRLAARNEFGQVYPVEGNAWDSQRIAEVVAVRQYQVWMETPGSFDILRKAMASAARWTSKEGFCWPIERRPAAFERRFVRMPLPRHHYHQYNPDE